ncbi:hypothetical protein NQ314_018532 [Rhamnusium bicolor]|uniref:PiggyBac transposable element-derived protein domain-containing protein n=1 Tax=Rhamnusium bicolor TaxID=1586634 RepID=A0AAV8WQG6_9CUCU|nr:hypothetical protein NQ314_018532 [Rhamnusium bicolor]
MFGNRHLFTFRHWKRPLTLNELLEEVENIDNIADIPNEIIIFPPENANDYNTDEDSGDETEVMLSNLPGSQLRGNVEVFMDQDQEDNLEENWDSEDEMPLSSFKKLKKPKHFDYAINVDLTDKDLKTSFPEWNPVHLAKNNLSPANTFKLFFSYTAY